jgi:hypothetical protein
MTKVGTIHLQLKNSLHNMKRILTYSSLLLAANLLAGGGNINGGGGSSGGSATNVTLTGDVTKAAGSSTTTFSTAGSNSIAAIAAGAVSTRVPFESNYFKMLVIGDSMSDITSTQTDRDWVWCKVMGTNMEYKGYVEFLQRGMGGDTLSNDVSLWTSRYSGYTNYSSNHFVTYIYKGYNDVKVSLSSAQQYFTNVVNLVRSNWPGSKIIVNTVPAFAGNPDGIYNTLLNYNSFIRTNSLASTYTLVDIAAMGLSDNGDGIHPNNASQLITAKTNAGALFIQRPPVVAGGFGTNYYPQAIDAPGFSIGGVPISGGGSVTNTFSIQSISTTQPTLGTTNWATVTYNGATYVMQLWQPPSYVETNGMVIYYPMLDNSDPLATLDWVSGGTLAMGFSNDPVWQSGIGSHYSVNFVSGSSQWMQQNEDVPRPSYITLSTWVKISPTGTTNQTIVSLPAYPNGWSTAPYLNYGLLADNTASSRGIYFYASAGSNYHVVSVSGAFVADQWTHLAGTYDGANMKIYTNGALAATQAQTGAIGYPDPTTSLFVGVRGDGTDQNLEYFNGNLTMLRIYTNALNSTSISNIYNSEKP